MNEIKESVNNAAGSRFVLAYFRKNKYFILLILLLIIFGISFVVLRYYSDGRHSTINTDPNIEPKNEVLDGALGEKQETLPSPSPEINHNSSVQSSLGNNVTPQSTTNPVSTPDISTPATPQQTQTPEPDSPSATVAFYADTQTDENPIGEIENHRRVVSNILATGANPIFHAGDLMEDGTQSSLDYFNEITTVLRSNRTFYSALGNNDREVGNSSLPSPFYLNNFSFPGNEKWYSVNIGNLHVVILDSAFSSANAEQRNWLIADLQSAASQSRITAVMYHHPAFVSSIQQYLIDYGVDFVVAGHNHFYNHSSSNGIHYFVTTGQPNIGFFLAKAYEDKAILSVYDSGNVLVESIIIAER